MKILFIVFKGIGDVILTTPLIKAVKKKYPDSDVFFLTKKFASPVLQYNPLISKVFVREELRISEILFKMDVAVDYMLSSTSAFYTVISGAKKRIGFYRPWNFIYNYRIKTDFNGYTVRKRFYLLKPLDINPDEIDDIKPEIYIPDKIKDNIRRKLLENNIDIDKDRIITMDITSPRAYRQLSGDKFMYIADKLYEKGYKIILSPAPNEMEYVEGTVKRFSKYRHILLKDAGLLGVAYLTSIAKLHIGTSSSPMHMAVSFNTPTFTVYSPYTSPEAWSPPVEIHSYIQGELEKLSAEEIYLKIEKFLTELGLI